jgi:hypothetical protein
MKVGRAGSNGSGSGGCYRLVLEDTELGLEVTSVTPKLVLEGLQPGLQDVCVPDNLVV